MTVKFNSKKKAATETKPVAEAKVSASKIESPSASLTSSSVLVPLTVAQAEAIAFFVQTRTEIDEYAEMHKKCELIKKEFAALAAANVPNDEQAVFGCAAGSMTFDHASDVREIVDMKGLCAALKDKLGSYDKVLELLKISLSDADAYLGAQEVEKYVKHVPGTRKIAGYVRL